MGLHQKHLQLARVSSRDRSNGACLSGQVHYATESLLPARPGPTGMGSMGWRPYPLLRIKSSRQTGLNHLDADGRIRFVGLNQHVPTNGRDQSREHVLSTLAHISNLATWQRHAVGSLSYWGMPTQPLLEEDGLFVQCQDWCC